jgi:hypothetical protein
VNSVYGQGSNVLLAILRHPGRVVVNDLQPLLRTILLDPLVELVDALAPASSCSSRSQSDIAREPRPSLLLVPLNTCSTRAGCPFAFLAKGGIRHCGFEIRGIPPFAKNAKDGAPGDSLQ